ncbi:protein of unknown function [Ralstonia solanacearum PSI07]|nr:protein of unknown function [Ralstonia solanacearum PSI07]
MRQLVLGISRCVVDATSSATGVPGRRHPLSNRNQSIDLKREMTDLARDFRMYRSGISSNFPIR